MKTTRRHNLLAAALAGALAFMATMACAVRGQVARGNQK
jgi:hypothetical protein